MWPIQTFSYILLTTNSSNDQELDESTDIADLSQPSPFIRYISNGMVVKKLLFCEASIPHRGEEKSLMDFLTIIPYLWINVP